MGEWLELTDYNGDKVLIRKSAVTGVSKNYVERTIIFALGTNYIVKESYDEVKAMLVRPDVIEMKYSDEDKETIDKWIEKLNSIGCQSFDPYQPIGAYTKEDFNKIVKNLGL